MVEIKKIGILRDIDPTHYFFSKNGVIIKSLHELKTAIEQMDNESFIHHVNNEKNDFSEWIKHIIKAEKLAKDILKTTSKEKILKLIKKRIKKVKDKKPKKEEKEPKIKTTLMKKIKYGFNNLPLVDSEVASEYKTIKKLEKEDKDKKKDKQKNKKSTQEILKAATEETMKLIEKKIEKTEEKIDEKVDSSAQKIKAEQKKINQKAGISSQKIDEILQKEKEIEKREKKIEEIEQHIENKLEELKKPKKARFFSKEFIQGIIVGILLSIAGIVIYLKFFA
ncbi:MAG: hypothetical protein KAK00_00785 [Nanoarchaeota archaeon]|nr:hypothetical protein [Nanoarchaeota archaeon]